ncbi:MAG: cystathionine beta-lyase [Bacteroidetes bacterium GWF2_33_16]|nr:MAG: cystathionine beta-lyase [Bacteroidetes bacterium GWE2_32_14]OFY06990.1 MAG: cystathionine beta-lyase [Bacteroidetes bacterium GWF2_33_16]
MKYNFDELLNRENTGSLKYDLRNKIFGKSDVIPMWVADMDFRTPYFIVDALKKCTDNQIFGYFLFDKSYYESIINWIKRHHQWEIKQDWISFSPGVVPSLSLLVLAFTQPGDKIIIQPPVYPPFFFTIKDNNRQVVENPLLLENGRFKMDFGNLEDKLKDAKMLILSNPHNPGGTVWKKEELKKLGELCLKHKVLVVTDEIHSDLVFKPNKFVPLASISEEIANITIALMAPSKTFNMAGLSSSSVIISNPKLKARFDEIMHTIHVGLGNMFGIAATEAAYNNGDEWLKQLLNYIAGNIDFVEKFLKERIPQIKMMRPEGTYLIWLDCRDLNLDSDELSRFFIEKANIGMNFGESFGTGGEGFMRMNVACPRITLANALNQLLSAFNC